MFEGVIYTKYICRKKPYLLIDVIHFVITVVSPGSIYIIYCISAP